MRVDYQGKVSEITRIASLMERRIANLEHALRQVITHAEGIEGEQIDAIINTASDALGHIGIYQG